MEVAQVDIFYHQKRHQFAEDKYMIFNTSPGHNELSAA